MTTGPTAAWRPSRGSAPAAVSVAVRQFDRGCPGYQAAARRSRVMTWLGITPVAVVVWLMAVKPGAPVTDHAAVTAIVESV